MPERINDVNVNLTFITDNIPVIAVLTIIPVVVSKGSFTHLARIAVPWRKMLRMVLIAQSHFARILPSVYDQWYV